MSDQLDKILACVETLLKASASFKPGPGPSFHTTHALKEMHRGLLSQRAELRALSSAADPSARSALESHCRASINMAYVKIDQCIQTDALTEQTRARLNDAFQWVFYQQYKKYGNFIVMFLKGAYCRDVAGAGSETHSDDDAVVDLETANIFLVANSWVRIDAHMNGEHKAVAEWAAAISAGAEQRPAPPTPLTDMVQYISRQNMDPFETTRMAISDMALASRYPASGNIPGLIARGHRVAAARIVLADLVRLREGVPRVCALAVGPVRAALVEVGERLCADLAMEKAHNPAARDTLAQLKSALGLADSDGEGAAPAAPAATTTTTTTTIPATSRAAPQAPSRARDGGSTAAIKPPAVPQRSGYANVLRRGPAAPPARTAGTSRAKVVLAPSWRRSGDAPKSADDENDKGGSSDASFWKRVPTGPKAARAEMKKGWWRGE